MSTILLVEGQLTPSCSKSHVAYTFYLKNKIRRLNIDFLYDPKTLDDIEKSKELIYEGIYSYVTKDQQNYIDKWESYLPLKNLLSVSVDDYKGFRGCAHRHSPDQHIFIAENNASLGFISGIIQPGIWKVTISAHAVITDVCQYKMHVWGDNG